MAVYPVDKPLGLTSHDVVARARRLLGTRKVGHAGTLDPLATGVLTVLAGEATKLSPYLTANNKRYLAWVALGAATPTLDAEGPVGPTAPRADLALLHAQRVEAAAQAFLSVTRQRPPAFSAVKHQGQRSYAAARRGELEEPPERPVAYVSVQLLAFARTRALLPDRFVRTPAGWRPDPAGRVFQLPPTLADLPTALFALEVGAGTYVRSFARDLGAALGVGAHLAGLVRTGAGNIDLQDCVPLDELTPGAGLAPLHTLTQPKLQVSADTALAVRQGKKLQLPLAGLTALHEADGQLVAMVEPRAGPEAHDPGDAPPTHGTSEPPKATPSVLPIRVLRAWQR